MAEGVVCNGLLGGLAAVQHAENEGLEHDAFITLMLQTLIRQAIASRSAILLSVLPVLMRAELGWGGVLAVPAAGGVPTPGVDEAGTAEPAGVGGAGPDAGGGLLALVGGTELAVPGGVGAPGVAEVGVGDVPGA